MYSKGIGIFNVMQCMIFKIKAIFLCIKSVKNTQFASPFGFFKLKIYQNLFSVGALSRTPPESFIRRSPDASRPDPLDAQDDLSLRLFSGPGKCIYIRYASKAVPCVKSSKNSEFVLILPGLYKLN